MKNPKFRIGDIVKITKDRSSCFFGYEIGVIGVTTSTYKFLNRYQIMTPQQREYLVHEEDIEEPTLEEKAKFLLESL